MSGLATKGILGKKLGMTQVFDEEGKLVPVTVIKAGPAYVLGVKRTEEHGYEAVKLAFEEVEEKKLNKPLLGVFKAAGVKPCRYIKEIKLVSAEGFKPGQVIKVDVFKPGEKVDVTGWTKGRGFTGHIKRWNFRRGPMSHGSKAHRRRMSIGATGFQRVVPGQKMAGRYGNERVTVLNLEVVKVYPEKDLLLVKGGVPGPVNGLLIIRDSVLARARGETK